MKKNKNKNINMTTLMYMYSYEYEKYMKMVKTLIGLTFLTIISKKLKKGEL